jgi:X-Pro dipeptidyl-peptidase
MYEQLYRTLKKHGVPSKIWLNQGGHGDGANSGARQAAWRDELNRFWSQYLFGVDNQWERGPRAAVQRENSQWIDYADWPVASGDPAVFLLRPAAALDNTYGPLFLKHKTATPAAGVSLPFMATTAETIVDDSSIDANALIASVQSPNRLVYKTSALVAPVHMSGVASVSLHLSFDRPAANVSAMVVDYRADGTARLVTRGWADPQNRNSKSRTDPVTPGTAYSINFDLQPHDYQFAAGSRIGFVVMSSDRLFTLRPPPGTTLNFEARHSKIFLPIVGGTEAAALAIP